MADAPVEVETINLTCATEYKDYKYNEKQDIWTLVTLTAPCQEDDEAEEKRPPIDIVAVIDVSGSMSGGKLQLVKKTLEYFLTQLNSKDRLSLVTYDTNVYLNFELKLMNRDNKEMALQVVKGLQSGSSTNLCGGLMKGLVQILNRGEAKNEVASVLLFTDGLANHGITDPNGIVAAMKDPRRFDGPTTDSHVPLVQHLNFLIIPTLPTEKPAEVSGGLADATVYTFGFGADHDPEMLKQISDAGDGMYYYIESQDQVAESFGHCLGGIMSTVAQGIQLEVQVKDGVTIKEVHTGRPVEKTPTGCKINIGDLQSEESRDVVVELTIDALPEQKVDPPQELYETRCDCFNVISKQLETKMFTLNVLRPEKAEEHVIENADSNLNVQRERVELTRAMKEISDHASRGNLEEARRLVTSAKGRIRERRGVERDSISASAYDAMDEDLDMYGANLNSTMEWESKGRNVALNLYQQQQRQRSNNMISNQFVGIRNMTMASKAKAFVEEEQQMAE